MPAKIEKLQRNSVGLRFDAKRPGDEFWLLLRSDVHHDNPKCNQELEKKHLDKALERDALIVDNGDLFCAMQGKYDKRASKDALRPEHQAGNYLDLLVDTAFEFYRPYKSHFAVLGRGNHETAIYGKHETDLTERLVSRLKGDKGIAESSGYGGWIRCQFWNSRKCRHTLWIYHYHGSGGGGPVTKGVPQTNRTAVFTPDADVILTGHTHDEWIVWITRQRISPHGMVYHDQQLHMRPPGYKDAWNDGYAGWEVERMHGPKSIGALWLRMEYQHKKMILDPMRAQ